MTDTKEVEESCKDKPECVDGDSVAKANELCESDPMREVDMSGEDCKEEKEEVEEEEEVEGEEEEEEEEEENGEEDEEEDGEEDETEEAEDDEEDEQEQKVQPRPADVSDDGTNELHAEASLTKNSDENMDSTVDAAENGNDVHTGNMVSNVGCVSSEVHGATACENIHADFPVPEVSSKSMKTDQPSVNDENGLLRLVTEQESEQKLDAYDSPNRHDADGKIISRSHEGGVASTAQSSVLKAEHIKEEELKNEPKMTEGTMDDQNRNPGSVCLFDADTTGGGESGTDDEQAAFMNELEKFHKERSLEFKPPKFYGEPLNLLKLWRAVMKLGGYDKVTACKYWRQVGESFKPPKTCTTVSWTFRIFYEKALLEYERYRTSGDGPSVPTSLPVPLNVENQASGSGRARRDAAARAMQGWHSQRILDNGEVSDPIIKDKNSNSLSKKEKQLKNLGVLKRKKPSSTDAAVKAARTEVPKAQSETTVIDIGSPADWVKINVRETKDCYEVYALVPGLLREEVRVQSDPAGRLVISGEPENPDNPWNVTPFKKVVSLPSRIDPHQTSAVVTLHGQLFVRVPFEQYEQLPACCS